MRGTYLLLTLGLGTTWFVSIVAALSAGVGAVITPIGIPLLLALLYGSRVAAQIERRLVRGLLGVDIPAAYRRPTRRGWWPGILTRLSDPQTYKDLAYLLIQFPLGIVWFTLTVTVTTAALGTITAPLWFWWLPDGGIDLGPWEVDTPLEALVAVLPGIALVVLAKLAVDLMGRVHASWARLVLAATPDPELTAQVVDARSAQARIIQAADAERRRIERDLHDGAQQRLVALSLKLGMARSKMSGGDGELARRLVEEAHEESKQALNELRDLARGIHPAILTDRGLGPALDELAGRAPLPVRVIAVPEARLPGPVEAAAYFIVAECLANVAKYAQASEATVLVRDDPDRVVVEVADDGVGGADPQGGSGLRGLADRVGALDGHLEVTSPPGFGTRVRAELPRRLGSGAVAISGLEAAGPQGAPGPAA
jgi:signal transduction histidine kinase